LTISSSNIKPNYKTYNSASSKKDRKTTAAGSNFRTAKERDFRDKSVPKT
jgi:hypothetical protein